ncbi:MAG: hypothetical protein NT021_03950 [Sphingobacteriales bacterium]|nr:hypothetical protein [Sphingobacteriales bacterium]
MKTIFTVALFAIISMGSACSKKNDVTTPPIDIIGQYSLGTVTAGGSDNSLATINADGTITTAGQFGNGTWVLKSKHFTATLSNVKLEGDISNMSPLKIEGAVSGSMIGTFTLMPL